MKSTVKILFLISCAALNLLDCSISWNGTSSTTFITLTVLESINYSFFGEGMAFDNKRDRFILGSLQFGTLIGVPRSQSVKNEFIQYGQDDVTYILSERPGSFNGSNFLGLEMNPTNPDEVWGCVAYGMWNTYGLARVNLSTRAVDFYNLSNLANSNTGSHAVLNDLVFAPTGSHVFVTDTWGYQIIRVDVDTGVGVVWSNGSSYCTECLSTEPHFDGPNGIAYVSLSGAATTCATASYNENHFLIVALGASSRRLLKVNASSPFQDPVEIELLVNSSVADIDDMDAIALSADQKTLYVVGNGVNSLFVLTSEDNWVSATVRAIYNANCPLYQPSAVALVGYQEAVLYCTNGFGEAPYPLTVLHNLPGKVSLQATVHLSATDMAPEGIAFDLGHKDRLLLGSTSTGAIRGVPRPPTGTSLVSLTLSEVYTYFLGGGSVPISSVKGLLVNPLESCQLWMAVDSHPIGVAMLDLCTSFEEAEVALFVDLTDYANTADGSYSSPNDLTFCGGSLYVTDLSEGYIWQIDIDSIAENQQPTVSIIAQFGREGGPNGIECLTDSFLLVSLSTDNRLIRLSIAQPSPSPSSPDSVQEVHITPVGLLRKGDGIKLDSSSEVLYVALHSEDTVLALVSCDNWTTAYVATSFLANCLSTTSSKDVTTLVFAGEDLWVLCSDGFGSGPYGLNRAINVSKTQVYSGNSACVDEISDDHISSDSDREDDKVSRVFLWSTVGLGSALGLTCLGSIVLLGLRGSGKIDENDIFSNLLQ